VEAVGKYIVRLFTDEFLNLPQTFQAWAEKMS